MHPEVCVHERKLIGFFMISSSVYQERVRCAVFDEAHLVLNWYDLRVHIRGKIYISAILNTKINRYTKAHATFVIYLGAHRRVNQRQTMSDVRRHV